MNTSAAVNEAISAGLLTGENLENVFVQGENAIVWFDDFFLHSFEIIPGEPSIYQSRPLADSWLIEDV